MDWSTTNKATVGYRTRSTRLSPLPAGGRQNIAAGWYVGFTCAGCGLGIPVIRGNADRREGIAARSLRVMCPSCGAMKLYHPADARRFRAGVGQPGCPTRPASRF
jgi:hypothetical protein